ncbi:hypothetical protein HGRIS_001553 [Hohenbuehelia grisea]|uniref:Uncharacterized protein n=1 Tax=Hohenbuehelia grisea TaxID=104357 RepID=A0ABR3JRT2_9AGAR
MRSEPLEWAVVRVVDTLPVLPISILGIEIKHPFAALPLYPSAPRPPQLTPLSLWPPAPYVRPTYTRFGCRIPNRPIAFSTSSERRTISIPRPANFSTIVPAHPHL